MKTMDKEQDKPAKAELTSMDVADDKRRQLAQLFPEVVTETRTEDGKLVHAVDYERLKGVLGEFSEILENQRERYGMTWPGKNECLKIIQQPSIATLKPCREESVNFDDTENLFIEGDNLEALKLLQKAYYGKVKMIYIDPPYNTGKEFIYPDNYSENLDTYLSYTGQVDAEGRKFSTNTEAEGRFHSKWLNMMLPRLYLARNLLRDDGVIFISIDDNEAASLKKLCDDVYGEENLLCVFAWQKRYAPPPDTTDIGYQHESIIAYRKSDSFSASLLPLSDAQKARYTNPDNDPRGPWKAADYTCRYTSDERPNLYYPVQNPNTGEDIWPKKTRVWSSSREITEQNIQENRLWWGADGTNSTPALKNFLSDIQQGRMPSSLLLHEEVGHTDLAAKELRSLIPEIKFTAKPSRLIAHFMSFSTAPDSIILDFFSGSCTTAHAVLDLNKQDGGNRKFIMVQLPEPCDEQSEAYKAGYKTIADIGKERIRRVIKKLEENKPRMNTNKHESKQEQLFSDSDISVHSCPFVVPPGFKVFKLGRSNFRLWDGSQPGEDPEKIAKQLELHEQHIDPNATQEDILYELLLKAGFPLTTKVEKVETAGKEVFSIAEGALLICLQDEITKDLIKAMADADPLQVICLDSGFKNNDQLKANAVQTFKARNKSAETATVFRTV